MSQLEFFKRGAEKRRTERTKYEARLVSAGLSPLQDSEYIETGESIKPKSKKAWLLHKQLLIEENTLTSEDCRKIQTALEAIEKEKKIKKEMKNILQSIPKGKSVPSAIKYYDNVTAEYLRGFQGKDELRLLAMQRLGLSDSREYKYLYEDVELRKYGAGKTLKELYLERPMD